MIRRLVTRASAVAAVGACTLGACAVGPSTRVATAVTPVVADARAELPGGTRALLDSLAVVRSADHGVAAPGTVSGNAGSPHQLWQTTRVAVDDARTGVHGGVRSAARDLDWLTVLRDPQLVALVSEAIANNPDVRVAHARVREYRAALGVARSDFLPQLTASAARSSNATPFAGIPLQYNATQVVGDVSWQLDFWGRVRRGAEAARFDVGASEEDVRATTLTLVGDVATAYLQLREADEEIAIADTTVASRRTTLEIARARYRQGVTSELDVRTFEAELADPATLVATIGLERVQQENRLAQLLGHGPAPISRGRPLDEAVAAVRVPDSIPGALLEGRPDVRASVQAVRASLARIGQVTASRLPIVTLSGDYGTQQPGYTNLFRGNGRVYAVQAGISVPLFRGGSLEAQEREAQARADETRAQYEQTVLTAQREASTALAGVRLGRDQLVAQATQVLALQQAFAIAQARYRGGIGTYLDVLTAQRSLFGAQITLVQDKRQYLVSTVNLYLALGGGWDVTTR
ncbi:MAG TPA: efflux transporter outer membrane subunit [Gemmatirosa sp.]